MTRVTKLSLAAGAVAIAAVLLAAATASATVLCKSNANTTTCANPIGKGSTIAASLSPITSTFFETTGNVTFDTCTESTLKATTTTAGSATTTVFASIAKGEMSWNNCSTPTTLTGSGELEIHWISGTDNGLVTVKGLEISIVKVGETCIYGFPNTFQELGELRGGNPAKLAFSLKVQRKNFCFWGPLEARWTASYIINEAGAGNALLYVTGG